jgi:hypothetical protein
MDSTPSTSAGASASSPIPSRRAAAPTSIGSPSGSAAAISSISPVSAGSASTRRRKLASIRPTSNGESGVPKPPASSALVRPRVSSSRASGLPLVSATIRATTRVSSGPWTTWRSSAWASRPGSPDTISTGRPASSPLSSTSRAAKTSSTDSACRRRPTKANAWADARSSHWPSSIKATIGRCPLASDRRLRTAKPTRNRSGAAPDVSPNAALIASRWGPGRRSSPPSSGATSWWRPAYASSISACTPAARSTRQPDARSTTYSRSDDLPTPGSPRTTSVPLRLARTAVSIWSSVSHSRRRPRKIVRAAMPPPGGEGSRHRSHRRWRQPPVVPAQYPRGPAWR